MTINRVVAADFTEQSKTRVRVDAQGLSDDQAVTIDDTVDYMIGCWGSGVVQPRVLLAGNDSDLAMCLGAIMATIATTTTTEHMNSMLKEAVSNANVILAEEEEDINV